MENKIILVDNADNEIGYGDKIDVHIKAQLHRAFSVFIFDSTSHRMLIQRRALGKYHSGGLWSNACCSHPKKGEAMEDAINDRLKEELGFNSKLYIEKPTKEKFQQGSSNTIYSCGKFRYCANFENLSENEIDHVYLYSPINKVFSSKDFCLNPNEVLEIKWISIDDLMEWLDDRPQDFSAWFKSAFKLAYDVLCMQESAQENCQLL